MNRWLVALTVMIPTLIEIIDTSVVNVSLGHIRGSLSAGIDESTWTITAYLVSNAIIIPMSGWLARLIGRKNYLMGSIALFTLSSFFCGTAWSLPSLIFFRILQGVGGGGLVPTSQSILLETFPPSQHGTAMAIFGIGAMFGPIIGPLLGGWITDQWSWRWIFYINIPIGILSIVLTMLIIHDPPYMKRAKMKIDYWGLAFLAVGLGSLQFILDKGQKEDWFSSRLIVFLSAVSLVSILLLIIHELRTESPVVNLKLFGDRTFAAGNIVMFLVFFTLFGSIVLLPIFLQELMGYTAFDAGLVLGPGGFVTVLVMPIVGFLVNKTNPKRVLAFGILANVLTTYLMSEFNLQTDFWTFVWPRVLLGIGMGFSFIPLTMLTLSHIPKEKMNQATSIYNLLRNIGGSFGIAFASTSIARRAQFHQFRLVEHLTPFEPVYRMAKEKLDLFLMAHGAGAVSPDRIFYGELIRQATAFAFSDTFLILSGCMACVLPFILILKRTRQAAEGPPAH